MKRWLVIDYTGHIGDMLDRTAKDVGATKKIYAQAEAMQFCSATLSRRPSDSHECRSSFFSRSATGRKSSTRVTVSSFVPAVRRIFTDRFGAEKVTGGEELTSVATGLALRAREQWPVH